MCFSPPLANFNRKYPSESVLLIKFLSWKRKQCALGQIRAVHSRSSRVFRDLFARRPHANDCIGSWCILYRIHGRWINELFASRNHVQMMEMRGHTIWSFRTFFCSVIQSLAFKLRFLKLNIDRMDLNASMWMNPRLHHVWKKKKWRPPNLITRTNRNDALLCQATNRETYHRRPKVHVIGIILPNHRWAMRVACGLQK